MSIKKLPNKVGDLVKIISATCFKWLPKVQKITQSGHTGYRLLDNSQSTHQCSIQQNQKIALEITFSKIKFHLKARSDYSDSAAVSN